MKNIVLIGAGKRVKETIIPSIFINKVFNIKQIISRDKGNLVKLNPIFKELTFKTSSLNELDLSFVDYIYIGIKPNKINNVIEHITTKFDISEKVLIIDTPPIHIKNIFKLHNFLKFKNIFVLEDWPSLLTTKIYKEFLNKKLLGDLEIIEFQHSSYKYHTLSLLRELFQINSFSLITKKNISKNLSKTIIFSGLNIIANIKEPRNYNIGKTQILGTKGSISDFRLDLKNEIDNYTLDYEILNNKLLGINVFLNGRLFKNYPLYPNFKFDKKNKGLELHKILKIISVNEILSNIEANKFDNKYNLENAIYDYLAYFIFDKLGFFIDLSIPYKKVSLLKIFIKLILKKNVV